jgi:hypothetical protein
MAGNMWLPMSIPLGGLLITVNPKSPSPRPHDMSHSPQLHYGLSLMLAYSVLEGASPRKTLVPMSEQAGSIVASPTSIPSVTWLDLICLVRFVLVGANWSWKHSQGLNRVDKLPVEPTERLRVGHVSIDRRLFRMEILSTRLNGASVFGLDDQRNWALKDDKDLGSRSQTKNQG